MKRERAKSMDQSSFWTVDAAGAPGKTAQAAHGFTGTRQNVSVRTAPLVHMGNVESVGMNMPRSPKTWKDAPPTQGTK